MKEKTSKKDSKYENNVIHLIFKTWYNISAIFGYDLLLNGSENFCFEVILMIDLFRLRKS